MGLDVEVKYSDGTIGELVMDEDEDDQPSPRRSAPREHSPAREDAVAGEKESEKFFEDDEVEGLISEEQLFGGELPEGMSIEEEGDEN